METILDHVKSHLQDLYHQGIKSVYVADSQYSRLSSSSTVSLNNHNTSAEVDSILKDTDEAMDNIIPDSDEIPLPKGTKETQWNWLREKVLNCEICLKNIRPGKNIVFGVGNLNSKIFFCGEAPGADEEIQGIPFVGKAGQLLTKIIQAMGLSRDDVYIANIMNWRPSMPTDVGNRPPTVDEMNLCLPYLKAQLKIVQPQVIVALGNTAVTGLLGHDPKRKMSTIRGQWTTFQGIPMMITFHPSYLLRNQTIQLKRQVWEDMLLVMQTIMMPISEKQKKFFLTN